MVAEYEASLKEYRDALEEAGVRPYLVYRVARGETNKYLSTTPVIALTDFDGPSPALRELAHERAEYRCK